MLIKYLVSIKYVNELKNESIEYAIQLIIFWKISLKLQFT